MEGAEDREQVTRPEPRRDGAPGRLLPSGENLKWALMVPVVLGGESASRPRTGAPTGLSLSLGRRTRTTERHMLSHGKARLLTRTALCTRRAHTARSHKEDPRWPGWDVVVGIEVHAQIKSRRKLFSGALFDCSSCPSSSCTRARRGSLFRPYLAVQLSCGPV